MSEKATKKSKSAEQIEAREARLARWMMQASTAAEARTAVWFGAMRGARGKLSARVGGLIDGLEGRQPALFARLRGLNARAVQLSDGAIAGVEQLTLSAVRVLRDGGQRLTERAAKAPPPPAIASAA